MLPKNKRIGTDSFKKVFEGGVVFHGTHFLIRTIPSSQDRYAVVVSKKVATKAVDRNRIRRRVYSLIQMMRSDIRKASTTIISAKPGASKLSLKEQQAELTALFRRANLI